MIRRMIIDTIKKLIFFITLIFISVNCSNQAPNKGLDVKTFKNPPKSTHLHTWWHWMDGCITREGITKDLEAMNKQGIAEATIFNATMFEGTDFGIKPVEFDSPQWYDMFQWALHEANRLDIILGVHNCDGWSSSGGSWITPELSMKQYTWSKKIIEGGGEINVMLDKPYHLMGYYKDVAVVAFKSEKHNSFHTAKPKIAIKGKIVTPVLIDGNPLTSLSVAKGDMIQFNFDEKFNAEKIVLHLRRDVYWEDIKDFFSKMQLSASNDACNFKLVKNFEITSLNESVEVQFPTVQAKYFKLVLNDSFLPFSVAEIELLTQQEKAFYQPDISNHTGKTGFIKLPMDENLIYKNDTIKYETPISSNNIIDLSDKLSENGSLTWDVPEGDWTIIRFGYTTTGRTNHPATKRGEGLECDKMDTTALNQHFENFPRKLINCAGDYTGNTFKFLVLDSWECGRQNWTRDFPIYFKESRGYNLLEWIPVLCGETVNNTNESNAFLYDFRKTISELVENNYYKHLRELCHRNKLEFHAEVIYGGPKWLPLDVMKTNEIPDLPVFCFWAPSWKGYVDHPVNYNPTPRPEIGGPSNSVVFSAHFPIVGAEAFTGSAHFSESLSDLKPYGDRAFCAGINQLILHSYVHQPTEKKPGMTLEQFGLDFNRHNLWWDYVSEWNDYNAKVQYVLQNSSTVSDVLYFIGDQLPQYVNNKSIDQLPTGYRAVACNFDVLKSKTKIKNGELVVSGKSAYKLLVLPNHGIMNYETLELIETLVKQGAVVYGAKPMKMMTRTDVITKTNSFHSLANQLWGKKTDSTLMHRYGKGLVISGKTINEVLKEIKLAPDFASSFNDPLKLMYIHKKTSKEDVYFVFNQTNDTLYADCSFRVGNKSVEIWNPMNGEITTPAIYTGLGEHLKVPVCFMPSQSFFFVFEENSKVEYITNIEFEGNQIYPNQGNGLSVKNLPEITIDEGNFQFVANQTGNYQFTTNTGNRINAHLSIPEVYELKDIKATVEFFPIYNQKIPEINITKLGWLTDIDDKKIKYFSGEAKYVINFTVPADFKEGKSILLDIGKFKPVAKIILNGKILGKLWMPGTKYNVGDILNTENKLEIEVSNLYRNRIIGDFIEYGNVKSVWTSAPVNCILDEQSPIKPYGVTGPIRFIKTE